MNEENNLENVRCEYIQVNQNYRQLVNLRFCCFGLYLIIFLIAVVLTFSNFTVSWGRGEDQLTNLRILWILITVVFTALDIYLEINLRSLLKTAKELEELLNLRQFKLLAAPEKTWLYILICIFYFGIILFWLVAGTRAF